MDKETKEFIENKFGIVEQRLTAIDGRLDTMDGRFTRIDERFTASDGKFDETKRYFGVLAEGLRSEIRQVAEGRHILADGQARKIEHVECELGAMIFSRILGVCGEPSEPALRNRSGLGFEGT